MKEVSSWKLKAGKLDKLNIWAGWWCREQVDGSWEIEMDAKGMQKKIIKLMV